MYYEINETRETVRSIEKLHEQFLVCIPLQLNFAHYFRRNKG